MTRLLHWLWNRALLYALLVVMIGAALVIGPQFGDMRRIVTEESRSRADVIARIGQQHAAAQREFDAAAKRAKVMPLELLDQRITQREADLAAAQTALADSKQGFLASYRLGNIAAGRRAEIEIALATQELKLLRADRARRKAITFFDDFATRPAAAKVGVAMQECRQASAAIRAFEARAEPTKLARQIVWQERDGLIRQRDDRCARATKLARQREASLRMEIQLSEATALRNRLAAARLPQSLAGGIGGVTLGDVLMQALITLVLITATPFIYRIIAYFVLAPMAARWPPMRFGFGEVGLPAPAEQRSAVSVTITLGPDDEALVRQDYLQSSSLAGAKRTRWLLDWRHPLTSMASGMRFLTAVRGAGERVTVSAVKDPFAELAVLAVPQGAACVLRPSALAGVVQGASQPLRITSHWRIFSLPALLTWQWRYLVFHGPVRLVVKGGRGVRIEPAGHGRIVGEGQILGFSAGLAYAVIRSETFWPYFFGREALLKDRLEAGDGAVLIEEAPLAGRSGLRRGFEGLSDAVLKLVGI